MNLRVEVDNNEHGQGVVVDEGVQDVALVVPVLSQVVVAAGDQKSLYKNKGSHSNDVTSGRFLYTLS